MTLESLLAASASSMVSAANILEENAAKLAGDDSNDPDCAERLDTLRNRAYRLDTTARRFEGVLIGMRCSQVRTRGD